MDSPAASNGSAARKKFNIPPLALNPLSLGAQSRLQLPAMSGWKGMEPASSSPARPNPLGLAYSNASSSEDLPSLRGGNGARAGGDTAGAKVEAPPVVVAPVVALGARSDSSGHEGDAYDDLEMDDTAVAPPVPPPPLVLGSPGEHFNEYYAGNDSDSDDFDMYQRSYLEPLPNARTTPVFPFRVTPALPPSRPSLAQDEGDNMSQATSKASRGNRRLDSMRHVSAQRALPSGSPSGRKSWSRLDGPGDTPEETPRVEQGEPGSPATAGIGPEASPRLFMTGKRSTSVQTVTMVTKSLFFFEPDSEIRCTIKKIVDSTWFENLILICIITSCITLTAQDPTKPSDTGTNQWLNVIDQTVLWFFVFEALAKMIAFGFMSDPDSYMRSGWNVLDFFVVFVSIASDYAGANSPLKPIRLLRALKSLRLLNRFKDMRILVETLILSFPALISVVIVMLFYLLFMAMIGVQYFKGLFHYQCHLTLADGSLATLDPSDRPWLCSSLPSAPGANHCEAAEACTYVRENRNFGVTSFDNIFSGILSIFVAITLEGWSDLMYDLFDTAGNASFAFTIANIFLGNFIIMNLALAVIFESYQATKAMSQEKDRRRRLERENLMAELAEQNRLEDTKRHVDQKVLAKAKLLVATKDRSLTPHLSRSATVMKAVSVKAIKNNLRLKMNWLKTKIGMKKRMAKRMMDAEEGPLREGAAQMTYEELNKAEPKVVGAYFNDFYALFPTSNKLVEARDRWMLSVVNHPFYVPGVMMVVFANMIALCSATSDMSVEQSARIDTVSTICSVIFSAEVLFHISAKGPTLYFDDYLNIFDFVIASLALLEMMLLAVGVYSSSNAIFSVLRAVRMLRFIKMAKSWKSLQRFLSASATAAQASTYMIFLMLLFVFMFAVMGRDMLAGKIAEGNRPIFQDMYWSALTIFQVISGENWNDVMYLGYEAIGTQAVVFLVAVYVIGNMLLMNLFIAILIDTFVQQTEDEAAAREEEEEESKSSPEKLKSTKEEVSDVPLGSGTPARKTALSVVVGVISDTWSAFKTSVEQDLPPEENKALKLLLETHPVRSFCIRVTESTLFQNFILLVVIGSTLCTILDTYHRQSPPLLDGLNLLFLVIFVLEACLKILAKGLWMGKDTYMTDWWNAIDFFTTLTSIISLEYPSLSWALALRSVRPLRLINRINSFRVISSSIVVAIKESSTIGVISFIFWLLLSLFGMQLFMGGLSHCTDPGIRFRTDCVGTFLAADGVQQARLWKPSSTVNFDDIWSAMQTTFEVATLEMWPVYMNVGVDMRGQNEAILPDSESSPLLAAYFVLVVLVFGFFIVNLFVGIVTDTFNTYKMRVEVRDWTPSWMGEEWIDIEKDLKKMKPDFVVSPPTNPWRKLMLDVSNSHGMELIVNIAILAVFFASCLEHYEQTDAWTDGIEICTNVGNILFASEIFIKLTGQGVYYFYSKWNWFDFVIGMSTLAFSGSKFSSMRVLRLIRVLRILNSLKGYRTLVASLVVALPGIMQAAGVLLIVLMIYAITGVYLFRDVVFQSFLNRHANFQDFTMAMVTLFRCATGESYNGMLHELMAKEADGVCSELVGNCGTWLAAPYFFTFVMIVQMILLNMFIAVTLASYTDVSMSENRLISSLHMRIFNDSWQKVDPSATGWVHVSLLADLLHDLPEPYGLKAATTSGAVRQYSKRRSLAQQLVLLKKLRLNMVDEMIDYKQVVFRIMSFAYLRLQTIQPTDEEHAWLLGRMNTYLFLRDQRQRRKRSNMHQLRKLAESAKRLAKAELTTQASERANEITEQEFFGLKEKSSPKGSQKMKSKLMSFRNTSRSFKEMVSFRFRQIAPHLERMLGVPLTTESKRKHAKATSRQTDIFVGPRPVHGHRLRAVEFYTALQIVGFHMKFTHHEMDITPLEDAAHVPGFERTAKEFEIQAMHHYQQLQAEHRLTKNKFSHAPTRRAEYFNQSEQKKSYLLERENENAGQSLFRDLLRDMGTPYDTNNGAAATPGLRKPKAVEADGPPPKTKDSGQ